MFLHIAVVILKIKVTSVLFFRISIKCFKNVVLWPPFLNRRSYHFKILPPYTLCYSTLACWIFWWYLQVWMQLFLLYQIIIFFTHLKNIVKILLKLLFFIPILQKFALLSKCNIASRLFWLGYNNSLYLMGGSLVLALGCIVDVPIGSRFDHLCVCWGYLKATGFFTKLSQRSI